MLKPNAVVELVWQDDSGSTATTTINAPSSATVEEIDVMAAALASILVPLTGAVLIKQRIKYRFEVVPRTEPVSDTPIVRSGAFFFSTSFDASDWVVIVPSIKEEVLSDVEPFNGYAIDGDNAAVIAFVAAAIGAGVTNPFGDAFTALVAAYRQSRV